MMKDKEAKERMAAWRALPEPKISWEGFKRKWQVEQAKKKAEK